MSLTHLQIDRLPVKSNDYWVSDEKGLRLLIKSSGAKYWHFKYRFMGKQKTLAFGVYPDISLKSARLKRDKARMQITEYIDPAEVKRALKNKFTGADENLFSVLSLEWFKQQKEKWSEKHAHKLWNRLKDNTFKTLDARPLTNIQPKDILAIIRKIESRDALDVASRVLQDVRRVFRYGVQIGRITDNPARELTGILKTRNSQNIEPHCLIGS
ncbi:hypothetical protein [uncultured Gammaproteobacteria bacterium]|nr:hypothetical protein [uncultured Gammaproteobacteria bacterium]